MKDSQRSPRIGRLKRLARLHGVQPVYNAIGGRRVAASADSLLAILRTLGVDVESAKDVESAIRRKEEAYWRGGVEPVIVAWHRRRGKFELRLPQGWDRENARLTIALETGEKRREEVRLGDAPIVKEATFGNKSYALRTLPLPADLPQGYHRLSVRVKNRSWNGLLIVAPRTSYRRPDSEDKRWGVFLPLYAHVSRRNWGIGDFTDLAELMRWIEEKNGQFVATLPLLAAFLDEPFNPSPYSPASRQFWNEVFIDVEALDEFETCDEARRMVRSDEFKAALKTLRSQSYVDYRGVMALKRKVLEALARHFFRNGGHKTKTWREFMQKYPCVEDYAEFRAVVDRRKASWFVWPERLKRGEIRSGDFEKSVKRYHLYVQYAANRQIERLGKAEADGSKKLYLDLPLGVNPDSYDLFRSRDAFVLDAEAGAPPDPFNSRGQTWGLPPFHPERIRENEYRPFIACLRHHMRLAGMLRIDHVMGLHRLFFVPSGKTPSEGVYVRYRGEEFYAIMLLESHRNRTVLVGEDLGTVPPNVRKAMNRHGIYGMDVLQFDISTDARRALPELKSDVVASLNTHDTPLFAAFLGGTDIEDRKELGMLTPDEAREDLIRRGKLCEAMNKFLQNEGLLSRKGKNDPFEIMKASLAWLARSRARIVIATLEDVWLETEPQNVPGTLDERPNWRRKLRHDMEEIKTMTAIDEVFGEMLRRRNLMQSRKG